MLEEARLPVGTAGENEIELVITATSMAIGLDGTLFWYSVRLDRTALLPAGVILTIESKLNSVLSAPSELSSCCGGILGGILDGIICQFE